MKGDVMSVLGIGRPEHITVEHVVRGAQMRAVVESDVTRRGLSSDAAVESLAAYLGISRESVLLGIAIANEWGGTIDLEGGSF